MGAVAAEAITRSIASRGTASLRNRRMLRLESISASTWSKVARSFGAGRSITSPGSSFRPVTAMLPEGQTIMHWPHAMQPNPLEGSIRISPSLRDRTSTGQIVAHAPHAVQVARSMTGSPAASPKLPMIPIVGLPPSSRRTEPSRWGHYTREGR